MSDEQFTIDELTRLLSLISNTPVSTTVGTLLNQEEFKRLIGPTVDLVNKIVRMIEGEKSNTEDVGGS